MSDELRLGNTETRRHKQQRRACWVPYIRAFFQCHRGAHQTDCCFKKFSSFLLLCLCVRPSCYCCCLFFFNLANRLSLILCMWPVVAAKCEAPFNQYIRRVSIECLALFHVYLSITTGDYFSLYFAFVVSAVHVNATRCVLLAAELNINTHGYHVLLRCLGNRQTFRKSLLSRLSLS